MEYQEYISLPTEEKLAVFMNTLSLTNRTPEYYVNWEKVSRETCKYELELNTLNYLIGKNDIFNETLNLFSQQPDLIRAIPSLIASRDKKLDVLSMDEFDNMEFYNLDFKNIDEQNILKYVEFVQQAGLLNFLANEAKRSLVDYVYGVEAGLDSNARKNRSGTTMEGIVERTVAKTARKKALLHKPQATAKWILKNWGIHVPVDKSERRFDEAVYNPVNQKLWLVETNYYGGGGSKLKAVAGEFTTLNEFIATSPDDVTFVWVTDGQGWHTTRLPLFEAFGHIENVFNLSMLNDGFFLSLFN